MASNLMNNPEFKQRMDDMMKYDRPEILGMLNLTIGLLCFL
jgi:hypothetical protein